jgi:hypothetical protein
LFDAFVVVDAVVVVVEVLPPLELFELLPQALSSTIAAIASAVT